MADTLYTIHIISSDSDFIARLNAGAAKEQIPGDPVAWVWTNRYALASAPTWAEKVDSWFASNPGAEPTNGWATNVAVISDNDIISQIQAVQASLEPPIDPS